MSRDYSSGQLVGIDLHRRRSVICRMSSEGEVLESVRSRAQLSVEFRTPVVTRA